jgi:hypothetical protein
VPAHQTNRLGEGTDAIMPVMILMVDHARRIGRIAIIFVPLRRRGALPGNSLELIPAGIGSHSIDEGNEIN